jgi:hypothetical protein
MSVMTSPAATLSSQFMKKVSLFQGRVITRTMSPKIRSARLITVVKRAIDVTVAASSLITPSLLPKIA